MQPILKISLEDIKSNWKSLNTCSNGKAAAVIKANAYGMGMLKVAGALLEAGCNYFYVANISEGIELRKKYKSHKIFIAIFEGYLDGYQKTYKEYNLIPIINSLEQLERLNQYAIQENKPKAILNIDTGMNRLGLNKEETAKKYGKEQVHIWRRSYETPPPNGESLKDVVNRVSPYFSSERFCITYSQHLLYHSRYILFPVNL